MSKRQMPDLSKLLAETAVPMPDAPEPQQFTPRVVANEATPLAAPEAKASAKSRTAPIAVAREETVTTNLENLNFKVPKSFRRRFRDCAYRADLKHNELLFAALDAWELAQTGKK
jgi:hypothetical protein